MSRQLSLSISIARELRIVGYTNQIAWNKDLALTFSHIAYYGTSVCDIPQSVTHKFHLFEKQASVLSNRPYNPDNLKNTLNNIYIKLTMEIINKNFYPLTSFFTEWPT